MRIFKKILILLIILLNLTVLFSTEKYLTLEEVRKDFLDYVNAYRYEKNLSPMQLKYSGVAQDFANKQAELDRYLAHDGFNGRAETIKNAITDELYQRGDHLKSFSIRENCCWFTICMDPAKKAFELFKKSSGHRNNMLQKTEYTAIGIAQSKTGAFYICQLFF